VGAEKAYGGVEGRGAETDGAVCGIAHQPVERGPDGREDGRRRTEGRLVESEGFTVLCGSCLVSINHIRLGNAARRR